MNKNPMNHARRELVRLVRSLEARATPEEHFDKLDTGTMCRLAFVRLVKDARCCARDSYYRVKIPVSIFVRTLTGTRKRPGAAGNAGESVVR